MTGQPATTHRRDADEETDVLIVGAGPCGLAAAISAMRAGLRVRVLDAGCVVSTITQYPTYVTFFSTAEKLGIGGLPFVTAGDKPTRRDALAYYRAAVRYFGIPVRQYEPVERLERIEGGEGVEGIGRLADAAAPVRGGPPPTDNLVPDDGRRPIVARRPASPELRARWRVHSRPHGGGTRVTAAYAVIVATGYFGSPKRLGVPGEELPHVTHTYREGHEAFLQDAVVVGGGNSAAEAALDLWRSGARVTLVHWGPAFDMRIKPWVLPDFMNRAKEGAIRAAWNARVVEITPREVVIRGTDGTFGGFTDEMRRLPADHVYVMTGFAPNTALLRDAGVPIDAATGVPAHDPGTLETVLPGLFIAGVVVAGYDANKVFIENGRYHGDRIVARLLGAAAPPEPALSAELAAGEHP
ncbi:MAG TPA: NAD(P)-binding domain-containing protein [Gemmatimonadaceae bacterium]|nr:NAD(P)-binding domain-containing protein [Gemmatimonadaceae bacterium]